MTIEPKLNEPVKMEIVISLFFNTSRDFTGYFKTNLPTSDVSESKYSRLSTKANFFNLDLSRSSRN